MTSSSVAVGPSQESLLRSVLESNGQRYTDQRASVYRFLSRSTEHPTADEVFTAVRSEISDISLATVYKALETLVTCGLAVKLASGDGSARYDARTDDHCHSRCLSCGALRDLPQVSLGVLLPELRGVDGFRVEGCRVEVLGYCPSCAS
jgi:Fur family transcriptional regulator, peroxide stress response regulator